MLNELKSALAASAILAASVLPCHAQVTDDDIALLREIMSVDTSPENAKAAHKQCLALQEKLAAKQPMDPLQRLYNEAEIEGCIAYALNNGKFTDDKGDACTHHMAFASKLDQVIREGTGKPGFQGEVMTMMSDRLKRATEIGPQLGCKGDYSIFASAVESAAQAGQQAATEPDLSLLNEIGAAFNNLKPETAKDIQKTCEALRPKLAEKSNRPAAERLYIEANIINCVVQAMDIGKYSDASGDVCSHTFSYARTMAEATTAAKTDPLYGGFAESFGEEVKLAAETAKGKGCKEDYTTILPK